jgi:hypothetical protein
MAAGFSSLAMINARRPIKARLDDVFRFLHKRKCDPVGSQFEPEHQIVTVLFGEGRQRQNDAGDIDTLALRQPAANLHPCFGVARAAFQDFKAQLAIIEQQIGAGNQSRKNL